MSIKWSAIQVSEAMDMVEEFVRDADLPLSQAKIVVEEARKIPNLAGYIDERLYRLIDRIDRIQVVKEAIKSIRKAIPDGAIEEERKATRHGTTATLM